MELPTYTSIWRIEKRLYKLYDFRLPMPLPVGQIAVFAAVTVPYIVLLTLFGLPFNHNLFWLYVLPPGLLTWLATRPVLESKRLPELIISQARYIGEPSTWCRMAPLAEKDEVVVFGRVWRRVSVAPPATAEQEGIEQREPARELPVPARAALPVATAATQGVSGQGVAEQSVAEQSVAEPPIRGRAGTGRRGRPARDRQPGERPAREQQARERAPAAPAQGQRVREPAESPGSRSGRRAAGTMRRQAVPGPAGPGSPASGPGTPASSPGSPGSPASGSAVPGKDAQRPMAADAGWARGAGPAADAAVRRDAGAAASPRAGRHAAPARPAAAVGYPVGAGGRPSGLGAEPRPVGEAGSGAGAARPGGLCRGCGRRACPGRWPGRRRSRGRAGWLRRRSGCAADCPCAGFRSRRGR